MTKDNKQQKLSDSTDTAIAYSTCCVSGAVSKADISIYNEDCLQALKAMTDNQFDLAIVDPPYGIGASADSRVGGSYTVNLGGIKKKVAAKAYTLKDWDFSKPTLEYWNELKRVSKNQIVWGGNYFASNLEDTPCWLVWNKRNGENNNADCEIAWTSFKTAVRMFDWKWNGMLQQNMKNKEDRIHPTQKPVALYKWILENYAEKGSKILDTHLGSGSIAIACWDMGYDLTAYEIDKEYFDNACKRLETHKSQLTLW